MEPDTYQPFDLRIHILSSLANRKDLRIALPPDEFADRE
jgi:hypothetical protein